MALPPCKLDPLKFRAATVTYYYKLTSPSSSQPTSTLTLANVFIHNIRMGMGTVRQKPKSSEASEAEGGKTGVKTGGKGARGQEGGKTGSEGEQSSEQSGIWRRQAFT
jgi:hypothetical protein